MTATSETPIEITFHGVEKSDAVEARILEKIDWLRGRFDRITYVRVVVELPHRHAGKGRIFHLKLEIGMPGGDPIVVATEREENHAHEDVQVAIRDAFDAARRRIDDVAARRAVPAKQDRGRRHPSTNGKIGGA